jgi:malate/lactate dehydrogenase
MRILIAGVGRLGSQIAMMSTMLLKPEKIMLYDLKELTGDVLDLQHACKGLKIKTWITTRLSQADYIIIAAGQSRTPRSNGDTLFRNNMNTILEIMAVLQKENIIKKTSTIIITTNPVMDITKGIAAVYDYEICNPEAELMQLRNNKELGMEIVRTKGYTNFGASMACILLIRKLEKQRKRR